MPRQKKKANLLNIGAVSSTKKSQSLCFSNIEIRLEDGHIMKSVIPGQENFLNIKADETNKLTFKNPNFSSKFRIKDKNSRIAKNVKNMVQDTLDSISYNLYQSIEAGPSLLPKRKYCDITGFESNYRDPGTGLRYYNSEIYKIVGTLTEPVKNQYLALRKALFIIK